MRKEASTSWHKVPNSKGLQYQVKKKPGRVRKDCYYRCFFTVNGKKHFIGLGWESEGMNLSKALEKRELYKENTKAGVKPRNKKEEIEVAQEQARAKEEAEQQAKREQMTFSEFWEKYYYKRTAKKSWRMEKSLYEKWISPVIGKQVLSEIKRLDLEDIKSKMEASGSGPRNIQYCLAVVRQVFNRAIDLEHYNYANPVKRSLMPSGANRTRKRILSTEEEKILLDELKDKSQLTHDITLMALYTGMRFSEIARMRWDDVTWAENKVTIYNAKDPKDTEKIRYAYFPDSIKDMLKERKAEMKSDLCFPGKNDNVLETVPKSFERAVNRLGLNEGKDKLNRLVFYSLRHTFASRLVNLGVHQFEVMALMGHSNVSTTNRYYHGQDSKLRSTAQMLDVKKQGKVLPMVQNQ